ncbi:MAG: hypothetical protein ACKVOI_10565 [Dongiaceae bacterium]
MSLRRVVLTALSGVVLSGAALADDAPSIASRIDLGEVSGVAYYTVEPAGYRVVATLAQGETGKPVRFETVLAPGQGMLLSTPSLGDGKMSRVEILRDGDALPVRHAAAMT